MGLVRRITCRFPLGRGNVPMRFTRLIAGERAYFNITGKDERIMSLKEIGKSLLTKDQEVSAGRIDFLLNPF